MRRILVCGGRDFRDRELLYRVLDTAHAQPGISVIIHGKHWEGADLFADDWARDRGVPCEPYPAKWKSYGRAAGPLRNRQMLSEGFPELVIAFPGGNGTEDMVRQAKRAGVPVMRILANR